MTEIIAICNPSGGVGKTTLTINLAEQFKRKDMKALVVDLDQLGTTSRFYMNGIPVCTGSNDDGVFSTSKESIDLIPSKYFYETHDSIHGPVFNSRSVESMLHICKDRYDIIIFDVPSSLQEAMYWALSVANEVLIPVSNYMSHDGALQVKKLVDNMKNGSNPDIKIGGIVLAMFDSRPKLSHLLQEELSKEFESELLETSIPIDSNVQKAYLAAESIVEYASASKAANAYIELTDELFKNGTVEKPNQKIRIEISIYPSLFKDIESKKREFGTDRSATIRFILEKGLEALKNGENTT